MRTESDKSVGTGRQLAVFPDLHHHHTGFTAKGRLENQVAGAAAEKETARRIGRRSSRTSTAAQTIRRDGRGEIETGYIALGKSVGIKGRSEDVHQRVAIGIPGLERQGRSL